MQCHACGEAVSQLDMFCAQCGALLDVQGDTLRPVNDAVTCPGCRATNPVGTRFCASCGALVIGAGPTLTGTSTAPPAMDVTMPAQLPRMIEAPPDAESEWKQPSFLPKRKPRPRLSLVISIFLGVFIAVAAAFVGGYFLVGHFR